MFDGLIFKILDKIISTCEKIREYMIERSLPKPCRSARDWAKDFEKHKKTLINKNDTE